MLRASYSRAYIHKKSLKFLLESVTLHIRRKKVRLLFMQMRERTRIQTSEMSDGILAQRSIAGDQRAFEILVQRYSTPLFNFICRFLSDYDQACDILQQVFLQLYISLPNLRTSDPLKAWLFQVARNRCLDELRRKHAIHFSELEPVNDDDELSPSRRIGRAPGPATMPAKGHSNPAAKVSLSGSVALRWPVKLLRDRAGA